MEPDSDLEGGVLPANIADLPATSERDRLGFQPYVRAVAEFLLNPATKGPLAMSVEGEWGSGKSSFMLQLEEKLLALGGEVRNRVPITIWFNAWRHDKADALWAAFALEFTRAIAAQLPVADRWRGHFRLARRRFEWKEGWIDLARSVVMWLTFFIAIGVGVFYGVEWLKEHKLGWPAFTALFGGTAAVVAQALVRLSETIGNPLKVELKKHLKSPNYEQHLSLIEQFHRDFSKIVKAYAGERPVFVFVDDLDRCEVPKAAELMQALNLMMPDEQELYFILGMDRHKVAAGLAVRHKELLPYLREGERSEAALGQSDEWYGLRYGFDFVEKFIQIPFAVPRPKTDTIEPYVQALGTVRVPAKPPRKITVAERIRSWWKGPGTQRMSQARERQAETQTQVAPEQRARREGFKLSVTGDTEVVQKIVLRVAPALGGNPRRIKQFLNLFRLRTFIAAETGLLDDGSLTLDDLGTFIAVNLRWPLLIPDLESEPMLKVWLVDRPKPGSNQNPLWLRWEADTRLQILFKEGSLAGLDLGRLMQVLPWVRVIDIRAKPVPRDGVQLAATVGFSGDLGASKIPREVSHSTDSLLREEAIAGPPIVESAPRVILSIADPLRSHAEQLARRLSDSGIYAEVVTLKGFGIRRGSFAFIHCLFHGDSISEIREMLDDASGHGLRPALAVLSEAAPAIPDELRVFPVFDLRREDGFAQLLGFVRGPQAASSLEA